MNRLLAGVAALVLTAAALAIGLDFRRLVLARASVLGTSYDAASHALAGLDLYDHLRLARPDRALSVALNQDWWPPVHGILLVGSYALFGRELSSASIPSLLAFALVPALALLLARRVIGVGGLWAAPAIAALFLFSPMLTEVSGWIMFESLGGCLTLAAWAAFFGKTRAAHRLAFALTTLLFLTKYHYGVFLGVTLLWVLLREEPRVGRDSIRELARRLASSAGARVVAALAALLLVARFLLALRPQGAPYWMPESNVFYGLLLLAVLTALWKRARVAELLSRLSPRLRDFAAFTVAPITTWLLLPGNLRAWYRQTVYDLPADASRSPRENFAAYATAFAEEYVRSPWIAAAVVAGVLFALVDRGPTGRRLRPLAAYALWPILLMSLSRLPAEARFLGCLAPTFLLVGILGWLSRILRLPAPAAAAIWAGASALLLGGVLVDARSAREELESRAAYRYAYTGPEEDFLHRLLSAIPPGAPAIVALDANHPFGPTVRLGLRLRSPELSPSHFVVRNEPAEKALRRIASFPTGNVAFVVPEDTSPELVAEAASRSARQPVLVRIAGQRGYRVILWSRPPVPSAPIPPPPPARSRSGSAPPRAARGPAGARQ